MLISDSRKFIFFAAGKTGTTTLESILRPYETPQQVSPEDYEKYNNNMPPAIFKPRMDSAKWSQYFKFSVVRNPWDWVVSNYIQNVTQDQGTMLERKFTKQDILDLSRMLSLRGITWSKHRTQLAFLTDADGKVLVDFVAKFENLQNDADYIFKRIGIPPAVLPRKNTSRHHHYSWYYGPETIQLVYDLYKVDVDHFGYKFENK